MDQYSSEELNKAIKILDTVLKRCERIQPKFKVGSSQHTLLKNRINALTISKSLINGETEQYPRETLIEALDPIISIISKCQKAQLKFEEGSSHHTRFKALIDAMTLAKAFIMNEIDRK